MRIWGILALLGLLLAPTKGVADTAAPSSSKKAPVRVHSIRDLRFGTVIPGLEEPMPPTGSTAGLYLVQADAGSTVRIDFPGLPTTIAGPGDNMPIRFENNSVAVFYFVWGFASSSFDPTVGADVTVGWTGNLWIFLGGVASPRDDQSAGNYSSPITLRAVYAPSPSS